MVKTTALAGADSCTILDFARPLAARHPDQPSISTHALLSESDTFEISDKTLLIGERYTPSHGTGPREGQ